MYSHVCTFAPGPELVVIARNCAIQNNGHMPNDNDVEDDIVIATFIFTWPPFKGTNIFH